MRSSVQKDRVATTSAGGKRIRIFPMPPPSNGFFNRWRTLTQWILIVIYLILPWIKISGHPLILIEIGSRRFSLFGKIFFAHETPILFLFAAIFLMGIAFLTSVLGRVWCGWACPQTVFVERIFRKIDIWVIGDYLEQKKLHESNWSRKKIFLLALKWLLYLFVTIFIAHSFLAYFVGGANSFAWIVSSPSLHPQAFFWTSFIVAIMLFDFGWYREQFCLIACPYGRFQSTMMDEGSLYMAYNASRGDCIQCMKCVRVCPTGIDVRNGLQFECIACTACADACDSVMEKIGRPKKLVGYGSFLSLSEKTPKIIRGRTILYSALLILASVALTYQLSTRKVLQTEISRAHDFPYQVVQIDKNEVILNRFNIFFHNLDWSTHSPKLLLSERSIAQGFEVIESIATKNQHVESSQTNQTQAFVKISAPNFSKLSEGELVFLISWDHGEYVEERKVKFVGPDR